jgi:uncharacterized protein (TIGR02246 family)
MKTKLGLAVMLAMAVVFFSQCSPSSAESAKVDIEKVKPEIQAMEDAFAAAEKAKDANAVVAYYSDDAVSYGRESEPVSGKEAIKAKIAKEIANDSTGSTNVYKVVDLFGEGDMLVEIGSWTRMDASGKQTSMGHYMSYFQKRNGKYVCVRDMNVSSMKAKPM